MTRRPSIWMAFAAALLFAALFAIPAARADAPAGGERGMTTPSVVFTGDWEEDPEGALVGPFEAAFGEEPLGGDAGLALRDTTWELIHADTFLARVPAGEAAFVYFDHLAESLVVMLPEEPIIARAFQAMDYAPGWLAEDLRDVFSRVDSATQDALAGVILGAADPIVDEVAFVVAHTAYQVLESGNLYLGLFVENAEDVYAFDPYLDYVEIIDYGTASAGGDYYSTVRYYTAQSGDTLEVELPRDRYYWDIVHPKITDEFPTYIDPATGVPADPPVGRFWREFLFTHADSGYPVLSERLAGCLTLWEGNVDSQVNGAVGIITRWVQDVLDFGSGVERPIQPVRIYRLHLGRCGEHADFTAAAARAALIATNSPLAPDEDHTWNEFWDERWVPWEPVNNYVDSGWHYEGWGKSILGVFNWRGDDWTWTVTQRYTPSCSLTVVATDSTGYPIDGAMVKIARKLGPGNFALSTWGYTDHSGLVGFSLGDNHAPFVRIESAVGTFPPDIGYRKAADSTLAGEHYLYERPIDGYRPVIPLVPHNLPTPQWETYSIRVTWGGEEFIYGNCFYGGRTFADHKEGSSIEFFILPEDEFAWYQAGDTVFAYEIHEEADSGDVSFLFPEEGNYYVVLSNEEHLVNKQLLECTVELYKRVTTGIAESGGAVPIRTALRANAPNPFNPQTTIPFSLAEEGRVELVVYDVGGRLVKSLVSGAMPAGEHRAAWDGTDAAGRPVGAGVYLCRLETGTEKLHRKMVLVK
ncbi:MAG: FlgD immunoglobulin-like domain containing protein [Candidatus Eisenbacteria bacterium]